MVLFAKVGTDKRLHRHAHAVHNDAEFNQADNHGERNLGTSAIVGGYIADHHVIHQCPAQVNGGIHDAVAGGEQEVLERQMPHKMEGVAFAQVVPEAYQNPQAVPDDGAENDSGHPHESCQDHRENDIAADLEAIADIVAQLVAITVNHLLQIEDHDGQEDVDGQKTVILLSIVQNLSRSAVCAEIHAADQEDEEGGDKADKDADDQSLAVNLICPLLFHRSHLPRENDTNAGGEKIAEERYKTGDGRDGIDGSNT